MWGTGGRQAARLVWAFGKMGIRKEGLVQGRLRERAQVEPVVELVERPGLPAIRGDLE